MPPATQSDIEHYFEHLQDTLENLGFLEIGNPRQTLTRLRRLYGRVRPDQMELSILRGMLTATQNYVHHTNKKIEALSLACVSSEDNPEVDKPKG
jgi:tRNA (cytidine32/uridine32-2'-O)-methyltransferase